MERKNGILGNQTYVGAASETTKEISVKGLENQGYLRERLRPNV